MPNHYHICVTTVATEKQAKTIAKQLLKQKLVACVNISSEVTSMYWWKEKIVEEGEFLLTMKTSSQKLVQLQAILLDIHPYEVPEFIVNDISSGSTSYFEWIDSAVS